MVRNDIACILIVELLFGTHTFHFNCFFDDFNCVFTQIRCLSRVLCTCNKTAFAKGISPFYKIVGPYQ